MARIVLGMATSHGPLLSTPPDQWSQRVEADKRNPELFYKGVPEPFDKLVELRRDEHLAEKISEDEKRRRFDACQQAIAKLAKVWTQVKPDVAIIVGDDQEELLHHDNMPAFMIFNGEQFEWERHTPDMLSKMPPGIAVAQMGHDPETSMVLDGVPSLGNHLIKSLIAKDFDVARSNQLPVGRYGTRSVPHAYGFVYKRIMHEQVVPSVPVFINTFYPPNQPRLRRSYDFGIELGKAIASWQSDSTVAVVGSGGLTHFVIEEDLDEQVLDAMKRKDHDALTSLPEERFNSGTSEIRNWIAVAGAMQSTSLEMKLVDYQACYRSEAGTGNAMAFAHWQ